MEESFNNDYVIQVEHGHPGSTTYTVYSTREHMTGMVRALTEALAKPEESLREPWHPASLPTVLWQHYATTAYGKSSRVSLVFRLANDLAQFHARPTFIKRMGGYAPSLVILLVLVFAVIGVAATIRFLTP